MQLWIRAEDACATIPLPEAKNLLTVLKDHLRVISNAERASGNWSRLIEELRRDMEDATIMVETPKDDHELLAEDLKRICENLRSSQKEARDELGA